MGMYLHAFTHDLSKFFPSEFFPYARKFFFGDYAYRYFKVEDEFEFAWFLHYKRNKHHWEYWVDCNGDPAPMPIKYVNQMIADWKAMSRKFGNDPKLWYKSHVDEMKLNIQTIRILEVNGFYQ
jgi:hypothetical protein